MKKLAAIVLLSLLVFNWVGYRLVTDLMAANAGKSLEAKLDNNDYDESNLIELRVSLNLPYQNDWTEFERYNGEVEVNGIQYKYVKRKIEKGQLVVLCIPNQAKMKIDGKRDDYFKMVNDLQQTGSGKKSEKGNSFAFKGLFNEYQSANNNWSLEAPVKTTALHQDTNSDLISSFKDLMPGQPPEYC